MREARSGKLTVDGVTVAASIRDIDYRTLAAGWMPDTEGLDMSIIAVPGKTARIVIPGRATFNGVITSADAGNCEARLDVTLP